MVLSELDQEVVMSLQLAAFAFGCFLLMITILGGGFEIKEIKVPKVGGASRLAACLCGFLFIGGGIKPALVTSMLDRGITVEAEAAPAPVTPATQAAVSVSAPAAPVPAKLSSSQDAAPRPARKASVERTSARRSESSAQSKKRVPLKQRALGAWREFKGAGR
jgi:hypothetical protein